MYNGMITILRGDRRRANRSEPALSRLISCIK
nr:MAG TPA: hypothetical protein [Caudoviricetes sp.]